MGKRYNNDLKTKVTINNTSYINKLITFRNLKLKFTNGEATIQTNKDNISELIGVATFPYNNISVGKVVANSNKIKISTLDSNVNGEYYTSLLIFTNVIFNIL